MVKEKEGSRKAGVSTVSLPLRPLTGRARSPSTCGGAAALHNHRICADAYVEAAKTLR